MHYPTLEMLGGRGTLYLLAAAIALAVLAAICLECLFKPELRQRALGYLYYRESDALSHPVPSLALVWSSLGSYLLLSSYFQWHSRYDDALLRICGLAAIAHAVLQLVLFVRHEYLEPVTKEMTAPEPDEALALELSNSTDKN